MLAQYKQKSSAYTLIEILVSLSIIGLLFAIGYANFRGFQQRQLVIDTAKSIQGDLRLAQEMALAGQKPDDARCNAPNTLNGYYFNVLSESSYQIIASCSGGTAGSAYKTVILSGVTILPIPSPNPILFQVLGRGTNIDGSQNASIKIVQTGSTNSSTVTVSSGGQIQ